MSISEIPFSAIEENHSVPHAMPLPQFCCESCADTAMKVNEIHRFLFDFAKQMESLGKSPMVGALLGNFMRKGKRTDGDFR